MGSKSSISNQKLFILFLFSLSAALLILSENFRPSSLCNDLYILKNEFSEGTHLSMIQNPNWYHVVKKDIMERKIKIGLVNMDEGEVEEYKLHGLGETVLVDFDRVPEDQRWEDYFHRLSDPATCPEMPMPRFEDYGEVDVVVARVPCGSGEENKGIRDVLRLQVNLVVANLVVNGWMEHHVDRTVYVVFIGPCGPMREIFRCDNLLSHEGDYWVYRPDLRRLKQKVLLPVGACLASPYAEPGKEHWRTFGTSQSTLSKLDNTIYQPREAYVTMLHSSESYVCGAIALAQSIIQSNSTKDLVLLADDSITAQSLQALKDIGWKIKRIERIQSPYTDRNAYNKWNYSKLRVWQLTEYDKVIFIDADFLVLENIDDYFAYPQLSAAWDKKVLFNSGIMLVEPSTCMFETLMENRNTLVSYNGGDQGFLNEVFTWWHRWPSTLNHFKGYADHNPEHEIPEEGVSAIHYFGLKPWMCYRDYDCNWDYVNYYPYASDSAHRKWWQLYDTMPKRLQPFCALPKTMDQTLKLWRRMAENASSPDGHWKIKVTDPRQHP